MPVIVLVLLAAAAGGWYLWKYFEDRPPSGWTSYKDSARGFRFDHPNNWGPAKVSERAGDKGKTYQISLPQPKSPENNQPLVITMESDDFTEKICTAAQPPQCITEKGFINQQSIKESLNRIAKVESSPWKPLYDTSSYTILQPDRQGKIVVGLFTYQIVNLPKIKVTAVSAGYGKPNIGNDCPQKLADDSKTNCITKSNYETLNKILKSFRSL
jgi:hypothetical protein